MKIVILGAGASYDCINRFHDEDGYHESHKWRPPLGNDIFGKRENFREIYNKYPGALAYSNSINAASDIEDFFQKKWEIAIDKNDNITLANLINTQYCLQELFYKISTEYSQNIGSNNYHILVEQAHEYTVQTGEDVVFITFNYDLLLESAMLKFYSEETELTIESYTKRKIKIFKPHGSCNWFKTFKTNSKDHIVPSLLNRKINYKELQTEINDEIVISTYPHQMENRLKLPYFHMGLKKNNNGPVNTEYNHCFPQLLIPLKTKDEFVMTKEHEELMIGFLKQTTDILVIGWKGQEAHFLNSLKNLELQNNINITIVAGNDETPFFELKKVIPNSKHFKFDLKYYETHRSNGQNIIDLHHHSGYFSSYILNVAKGNYKGFFDVE